ncbi:MAG: hypothetical protein ACI9CQ_002440, partial [Saprospiraceae bacterium]
MQGLAEFRIFYNHTIHPELVRMEMKRKQLLWLFLLSIFLLIAVIGLDIYLGAFAFALVLMIPLGLWTSFLLYRIQRFRSTFKPQVVDLILDFVDDDANFGTLSYDSKKFIDKKRFMQSGLFGTRILEYNGEDFISGKIGELDFELCELSVKALSRVKTDLDEVFRGVFLHATFNTQTEGAVIVWPRETKQYRSKAIKNFISSGGKNVDHYMEVESFRELFTTYATSEAHVDKTLNREMQIALADYRIQTDKAVYFSFMADNVYIGVTEPKDILEPSIFKNNTDFELVQEFFEDLRMLFSIVEA